MDKELQILNIFFNDNYSTQRELSNNLGISVGSINILLKKMMREGLIKVKKMPSNRFAYMLTPKGIQEKYEKTIAYVSIHYRAIYSMKMHIKRVLLNEIANTNDVQIYAKHTEVGEIIREAIREINQDAMERAIVFEYVQDLSDNNIRIVQHDCERTVVKNLEIAKIIGDEFQTYVF